MESSRILWTTRGEAVEWRAMSSIPPHTHLFTDVNRTSDPDFFVRFMDEAQNTSTGTHWSSIIQKNQTTGTIVLSCADSIRNGWIGRQLPHLFKEQHLDVHSFDPVCLVFQTHERVTQARTAFRGSSGMR